MGMTFYPELTLAEVVKIMTICSLKLIGSKSSILRCFTWKTNWAKKTGKATSYLHIHILISGNWSYVTFHDKKETWNGLSSVSNGSKPESLSRESRAVRDMLKDVTVT